jgi:alkylation response protein AidB-like acyl-CoA dehydrogenase
MFVVESGPEADGPERTHLPTLDLTRRQASLHFDGVPAALVAGPDTAPAALTTALRTAGVLLAAEQLGGAQCMLDRTVEHLKQRVQFGRPLGSFQALKHRCADMMIAVEQARSVTYHAAWALQDGLDDPDLAVSLAQAVTSDAYFRVAAEAIQLHGGLGFTWEHPTHLYFKRATADRALLGSGDDHLEQLARMVLDQR